MNTSILNTDNQRKYPAEKAFPTIISSDLGNNLREVTESIVERVERTALIVNGADLEKIFKEYHDKCENSFEWVESLVVCISLK